MFGKIHQVHLVGIGGSGMNGIAEVLLNRGYQVSGSDQSDTPVVERLRKLGAKIAIGHHAANLGQAQAVVISSAIAHDNPEVSAARNQNIPVIPRAEMLGELMRGKDGIAVAGAHGKTTTTSLILQVLAQGNLDPTAVIGGKLNAINSHVKLGQGRIFIAEADESDGSFLKLTPTLAIITNIDREHLNHYGTMETLMQAFVDFGNLVPFYGAAIVCVDDPMVQKILARLNRRVVTYGLSPQADLRGEILKRENGVTTVAVYQRSNVGQNLLGEIHLCIPGMHNVRNALAAVATGLECEVGFAAIAKGLEEFSGIERRFQKRGELNDVLFLDDYAHHPVEISATLDACHEAYPQRRLIVAFQPHRYTRLRDLFPEFAGCFSRAKALLLLPVYAAGENPILGMSHLELSEAIRRNGFSNISVAGDRKEALSGLKRILQKGDLLITLGAGDIWRLHEELLKG